MLMFRKTALVACSETHPSLPHTRPAAERISEAFSELLSMRICHAHVKHIQLTYL